MRAALLRELQQVEFFAPFGNGDDHSVEKMRGRGEEGNDDLFGQRGGDLFGDDSMARVSISAGSVSMPVVSRMVCTHDRAVADAHEIAVSHVVIHQ